MVEIIIPKENANDDIVIVGELLLPSGSKVAKGQCIAELETSKVNFTMEAPEDGFIQYKCENGAIMEVGETLAVILEAPPEIDEKEENVAESIDIQSDRDKRIFSNEALRLIDELGITDSQLPTNGFVTSEDIRKIDSSN